MNNFDDAIFPEDYGIKGISKSTENALSALKRCVGNLEDFVAKGSKIIIEVSPEDGFISVQLTTKESK